MEVAATVRRVLIYEHVQDGVVERRASHREEDIAAKADPYVTSRLVRDWRADDWQVVS
jgi:hypothetical protein